MTVHLPLYTRRVTVRTENGDSDSALASAGPDLHFCQNFTAFANYMVQAGQSNYFGQFVQGGIRIGF